MRAVARRLRSPALLGTVQVLRLLPRVSPRRTALLAALTLVLAALPIATTIVMGLLVGSIPAVVGNGLDWPGVAGRGGDGSRPLGPGQVTLALLAGVAVLAFAGRLVGPVQSTLAGTFARRVNRHLQERVIAAVGRPAGIAHLEDPRTLDLIKNAQGVGTEGLQPGDAVTALATLIPSWLQALGAACVLLAFSPLLGIVWLVLWPVVLAFLMREYVRVGQAAYNSAATVRRADYVLNLALLPAAAKELRIWGMLDWLLGRYDAAWRTSLAPVWRVRNPNRLSIWLAAGAVTAVNLSAYLLLAVAALRGDLTLGALAIYIRAALEASALRAFDDPNAHLAYAAVSVPALLELERHVAALEPPARPAALPAGAPRDAIRFERLSFRYAGQTADVLADLDLEIPAGRSLAIVGANGAGKTTLIKLLCALYRPTAGRITIDGHDLAHADPRDWQRRVAAIFQDFVRYELSVRENVGLGAPALAHDDARLCAAARNAGALDLVESLPHDWDTVLSRRYTHGTDLSGGQWQRIALARALFAVEGGARLLILDEPTAALDVRAEAALYDRFLDITRGLTTIVISHRFSTVRRAGHIVVLDHGRIAEQGTHEALVAAGGHYAHMFALQASRFAEAETGAETDAETGAGVGVDATQPAEVELAR